MNRFMGIAYVVSTVALFSWLLGQPPVPPRVWVNDWFGMIAQVIVLASGTFCALNAIWRSKDGGEK